MEYRILGKTELRVSAVSLGCSRLGQSVFQTMHEPQGLRLLEGAVERGINFFDTAPTYCYGDSEKLLGKAFAQRRSQVFLATKGGLLPTSLARFGKFMLPLLGCTRPLLKPFQSLLKKSSRKRTNFHSRHLRHTLDQSLSRLQTSYVDLYQLHNPSRAMLEEAAFLPMIDQLKKEGKIRFFGISTLTHQDALFCIHHLPIDTLQVTFNLLERDAARQLFWQASKANIGLIIKTPLARGMLTGTYLRKTGPEPEQENTDLVRFRKERLDFVRKQGRESMAAAALRYILDFPEVSTILCGTKNLAYLDENLEAFSIPSFSTEERMQINQLQDL